MSDYKLKYVLDEVVSDLGGASRAVTLGEAARTLFLSRLDFREALDSALGAALDKVLRAHLVAYLFEDLCDEDERVRPDPYTDLRPEQLEAFQRVQARDWLEAATLGLTVDLVRALSDRVAELRRSIGADR